ncbi:hypothetical protein, partial [Ancrocorticia populi]|uniref:hypothetical protein n=1 Tax=Ancrocorticia populi TaxID=2175228 RepID=UPI003F9C97D8
MRLSFRVSPHLHQTPATSIRLTMQETGQSRIDRRAAEPPDTYRAAAVAAPGDDGHRPASGETVE